MVTEKTDRVARIPAGVKMWRHGQEVPDWVRAAIHGAPDPNGTFLINAALGRQRVHRGSVIVEQGGHLFTCPLREAEEHIRQCGAIEAVSSSAAAVVGPGKSLRSAILKRRPGGRIQVEKVRRSYPPVRGAPPSIEWVALADLQVDDSYQRSIDTHPSRALIASIAARWDWRLCTPLAVARRDLDRYVIDGQHRLAAARLRGDIPHLPCSVATYDGPADEAAMFVAANRARRAINRLDDFHAALVAGDEDAIEVNRIVMKAGLKVARRTGSQSWAPGEVAFTSSVQTVMGKHGEEVALSALRAIKSAFDGQILSNGASVFLGLTRILVSPPPRLNRDRLFAGLTRFSMREWGDFVQGVKGGDARHDDRPGRRLPELTFTGSMSVERQPTKQSLGLQIAAGSAAKIPAVSLFGIGGNHSHGRSYAIDDRGRRRFGRAPRERARVMKAYRHCRSLTFTS